MSSTYWKANKETSAEIEQVYTDRAAWMKERTKVGRRLGFSNLLAVATLWFGTEIGAGFYLKRNADDPDKKLYKKSKQCDERGIYCWIPKRVKVNKEINALLSVSFPKGDRLADALGIQQVHGNSVYSVGICIRNGTAYIEMDEIQGRPSGCRQITDMTFRKARALKK